MITEKELLAPPISALFPNFDSAFEAKSFNAHINGQNGQTVKCSTCNRCLQELFRQGCYLMFGDMRLQSAFNVSRLPNNINEGRLLEKLCLPDHPQIGTDGFCRVCDTRVIQLKIEAARAIRNLKRQNQLAHLQPSHWQTLLNRQIQCHPQGQNGVAPSFTCTNRLQYFEKPPTDIQPSKYPFDFVSSLHQKNNSYRININNHRYHPVDYSKPFHWAIRNNLASTEQVKMINNNKSNVKLNPGNSNLPKYSSKETTETGTILNKDSTVASQSNLAAAASFFAKAGKKPITSGTESTSSFKRKKKIDHSKSKDSEFMTCFSEILKNSPPPVPPTLLKTSLTRPLGCNTGKIKVIIKLKYLETSKPESHQNISPSQMCITVDNTKKQITVFESQSANSTPRRVNANIPKIYAFDAVYTVDDDPTELCSNALTDIIQSVVSGIDGCVFSFGHLRGSSNLIMIGSDQQTRKLGLIPCAISWLFRLICEQKEKTGARFSVRVSAIEVYGKQEILKDLLSDIEVIDNVGQCSPGVYLRDDPVSGTQLQNQSELRAPTAEKAAYYLDAALAARTMSFNEEDTRLSHFLFTLHVYQYRVERGTTGSAVAGGRSRLHMLDFGSGRILSQTDLSNKETTPTDSSKPDFPSNSTALSLSATAAVLLALVNGQRHIPYRTSKLSQLLREAMSSLSCRTCMVAHVAMNTTHCADSMQIIQFASKLQRLKRRKFSKLSGTSSDDSSSCDSFGFRRASRHKGGNAGFSSGSSTNGMTSSEADYTSSSEQSCDTVIYLGASRNKGGDEHSSFILRKRRISAPSFSNAIPERSGSESDLLKLDISKHHNNHHQHSKATVRTNALVWPKVAAKNAIETLSTQKEMWVDGPMVSNKTKTQSPESAGNISKFTNTETQTYSIEHNSIVKESNTKAKPVSDVTQPHELNSQITDINANIQKPDNINTVSMTSTTSTSNDNPSSQESTTAAVGSSDGDHKLTDLFKSIPTSSHSITTGNIHSSNNNSSQLPSSTTHHIVSPQAYKPFVWDWVEKHSDMVVDTPLGNPLTSYPFQIEPMEDVQPSQKRAAKHCAKHQQMLKKSRPAVNNDQVELHEREGRKRHKSAKHKTAQTTGTYENYKTNQFSNPSAEPNFTRVAEWVRSVSEETNRAQSLSPIRRNHTVKENKITSRNHENIPTTTSFQTSTNYRSLDRHAQGFINMSQAGKYPNFYMESTDLSHSSVQFPCVSLGSKTFDSIPLPSRQIYHQDMLNLKKSQNLSRHTSQRSEIEIQSTNPVLKRGNSQNEDSGLAPNSQLKSQNSVSKPTNHTSSKHNTKNSPTRQILERNSPNKTRSSSLIKNALFGRCKLSSSSNIDDNNQYSVPNSPCKNSSKQLPDFIPLNNTGGYHYVVMTSSLSTPAKQLQEETAKAIKRRSSSTSPGKSSGSSLEKKQLANTNKREKVKEKSKEIKNDNNKIKNKKESKKKLSFLTSPLFGKKKDKDKFSITAPSKATKQQKANPTLQSCSIHHGQHENSSKVISPYCTVTQPKHSAHSSSGHGSDCSSLYGQQHKFSELAGHLKCRECTNIDEEGSCLNHIDQCNIDQHQLLRRSQRRGGGHTSSGYESILRDSEVSSQNDSTSESSLGVAPRAQTPEKQQSQSSSSSSKQSRSAPNRSEETSEDTQSPVSVRKLSPKTSHKTPPNDQLKRENEIKKIAKQIQFEKIYDLLAQQDMLKTELLQSKERILVDPTSWSYDLHVVEQMDPEDSSFIEALEKETDILRRRVEACKSHVLLITYFDIKYIHPTLPEVKSHSVKLEINQKTPIIKSNRV